MNKKEQMTADCQAVATAIMKMRDHAPHISLLQAASDIPGIRCVDNALVVDENWINDMNP